MANIELVIKISEKTYNALTHTEFDATLVVDKMRKAIANGTPLPKNHGRLIDAEELLIELGSYHIGGLDAIKNYNGENTWTDGLHTAWSVIDDAETIIPADKEE